MKKLSAVAEITVSFSYTVPPKDRVQVKESRDAFEALITIWNDDVIAYQEAFVVLFLNRANVILGYRQVSSGGTSATVVDVKHIFGLAVKCNASSIILAHNHPSCNLQPSSVDVSLTKKIKQAGDLLDVVLLDHLIISPDRFYYSFADEGVL